MLMILKYQNLNIYQKCTYVHKKEIAEYLGRVRTNLCRILQKSPSSSE